MVALIRRISCLSLYRHLLVGAAFLIVCSRGWAEPGITIGQSADFSRETAAQVKAFTAGATLWFNAVNARGGINGKLITLRSLDDRRDVALTVANTRRLIKEDRVSALLGYRGTEPTLAALPLAEEALVPMVAPMTGADSLREPSRFKVVFPVRASYTTEIDTMVRYLGVTRGTVTVFYQDDSFGRPLLQWLRQRLRTEAGFSIVAELPYDRLTKDVSSQVQGALKANADIVFAFCNPATCNSFAGGLLLGVKARALTHKRPWLVQNSIVDAQEQFEQLGALIAGIPVTTIVPDPRDGTNPLAREFRAAAEQAGISVSPLTFEGYISAKVLVRSLQGAKDPTDPRSVLAALTNAGRIDLGGFSTTYSAADRRGSQFAAVVSIDRDGRLVR